MKNTMPRIIHEVTPLTDADCLLVFSREKSEFDFPLHTHDEFELNFIQNAKGAKRVVGDSVETIKDLELTLITGSNLEHGWLTSDCKSKKIKEITIQFQCDMLGENLLKRNSFKTIEKLFNDARKGVTFSEDTIEQLQPEIEQLAEQNTGITAVLRLISILHHLSVSENVRILASSSISGYTTDFESRRIGKLYGFLEKNYQQDIRLNEVASLIDMSEVAFCRFIKQRTGKTFVETLNDIRIGHAVRLLINTTKTVSEICHSCGFNNLSNFNRLFQKKKKYTPSELRRRYAKSRIVI